MPANISPKLKVYSVCVALVTCCLPIFLLFCDQGQVVIAGTVPKKIQALIDDLGSDEFQKREEAYRSLLNLEGALPELEKLTKIDDLERRRRVGQLIKEHKKKQSARCLRWLATQENGIAVDLFVEALLEHLDAVDEAAWTALVARIRPVCDSDNSKVRDHLRYRLNDFLKYPVLVGDKLSRRSVGGRSRILAKQLDVEQGINDSFVLSRGSVAADTVLFSAILANGDINIGNGKPGSHIGDSFIFCDGNVKSNAIEGSIVIATGQVTRNSSLRSTIRERIGAKDSVPEVFNIAQLGMTLHGDTKVPRIRKIIPNTIFSQSGLVPEDLITGINDFPLTDGSAKLRHVLRRYFVQRPRLTLQIERGGKSKSLDIPTWK